MKIAVNKSFGGFDLSTKVEKRIADLKGLELVVYISGWSSDTATKYDFDKIEPIENITFCKTDMGECPKFDDVYENSVDLSFSDEKYRNDKDLIQAIEELGEEASGIYGDIEIVEVPDDIEYTIINYDGIETVVECGHFW